MSYRRLNIPITDKEYEALCRLADKEMRNPKFQARFLIQQAVMCEQEDEGDARTLAGESVTLPTKSSA